MRDFCTVEGAVDHRRVAVVVVHSAAAAEHPNIICVEDVSSMRGLAGAGPCVGAYESVEQVQALKGLARDGAPAQLEVRAASTFWRRWRCEVWELL